MVRKERERRRRPDRSRGALEWVGGRVAAPAVLDEAGNLVRPDLVLWLELPEGTIVGHEVSFPDDPGGALGSVLYEALQRPHVGAPRRPDLIRVANAALADEVRAMVADLIPVKVAPTPELDDVIKAMAGSIGGDWAPDPEPESYLGSGILSPAAVGKLFAAAKEVYRRAPWRVAHDSQVLRIDVPALGVEGACLSIIGRARQSLGFLVFPSRDAFEGFALAAEQTAPGTAPNDLGTSWVSLSYERKGNVSPTLRREIATHAWPLASAAAVPLAECRERDLSSRAVHPHDLALLTACAQALVAFVGQHRGVFGVRFPQLVDESYGLGDGIEARVSYPFVSRGQIAGDFPRLVAAPAAPTGAAGDSRFTAVGRNDPCPCGSGKKYKHCHLKAEQAARAGAHAADPLHELDHRLVDVLAEYASTRFGAEWFRCAEAFADVENALQLAVPWAVYGYAVQGRTIVDQYLVEHGQRMPELDRRWLVAQRESWLSVWEVTDVKPEIGISLQDLLTGETVEVRERLASRTAVVRDALLARVVRFDEVSLLCGAHPRPLPPLHAAEVVRRTRSRLRLKARVPPHRLRDGAIGAYLIRRWEEEVAALEARHARKPDLHNTDGDPLLWTTDYFEIAADAAPAVEARLGQLEGVVVHAPLSGQVPRIWVYLREESKKHRPLGDTVIGQAEIRPGNPVKLVLETNSRGRADALRALVEAACGELVRHRGREHADPLSDKAPRPKKDAVAPVASPEVQQLLLDLKERFYADWVDQPLPALGGSTPRAAARSAQGRAAVDVLLKDMENHERRAQGDAAFDFSVIRRQLGLE